MAVFYYRFPLWKGGGRRTPVYKTKQSGTRGFIRVKTDRTTTMLVPLRAYQVYIIQKLVLRSSIPTRKVRLLGQTIIITVNLPTTPRIQHTIHTSPITQLQAIKSRSFGLI